MSVQQMERERERKGRSRKIEDREEEVREILLRGRFFSPQRERKRGEKLRQPLHSTPHNITPITANTIFITITSSSTIKGRDKLKMSSS